MIEAALHDGTVLEFPDETSPDVIQRTVKRQLGLEQPARASGRLTDDEVFGVDVPRLSDAEVFGQAPAVSPLSAVFAEATARSAPTRARAPALTPVGAPRPSQRDVRLRTLDKAPFEDVFGCSPTRLIQLNPTTPLRAFVGHMLELAADREAGS